MASTTATRQHLNIERKGEVKENHDIRSPAIDLILKKVLFQVAAAIDLVMEAHHVLTLSLLERFTHDPVLFGTFGGAIKYIVLL